MSSMIQEMQTFMKFSHPERRSICLLLDFAKPELGFDLDIFQYWLERSDSPALHWPQGALAAAHERLAHSSRIKDILLSKGWESDYQFYAEALRSAVFIISNGYLRRFEPFQFLLTRLFGVEAHPHIPSLYAAAILHSSTSGSNDDAVDLLTAMEHKHAGPRGEAPAFFPSWTDL